jgi:hypothetical protein
VDLLFVVVFVSAGEIFDEVFESEDFVEESEALALDEDVLSVVCLDSIGKNEGLSFCSCLSFEF